MASQLLYTSAPRLLEAGRSGFGTVARHRAVGGLLVAAVERASQFGRAPGQNVRRVVLSHRVIHAGAGSYHVFSCVRDAGSDYTGRTNHLAHHLIADAREARAAAETGLTPVDILRQMRWRTAWSEAPRFFEPSEEVPLAGFQPAGVRGLESAGAWQRATGKAEHALLAAQSQRCLLLLPDEDMALPLFGESLRLLGGPPAWLVTFSTHAEPGDDLADLRWLALRADSPLRPQVESASRVTYDLTRPGSLPAPRVEEARAIPQAAASVPPVAARPAARLDEKRAAAPLPPLFPEPPPRRRSAWPYVAGAAGIAVAGIASFFVLPRLPVLLSPRATEAESAISLARAVDDLWQRHRLELPATRGWLKAQADAELLGAHERTLEQVQAAIREPLRAGEVSLPARTQDDFTDMVARFRDWQKIVQQGVRDTRWSGGDVVEVRAAAQVMLRRMKEAWAGMASAFRSLPEMPDVLAAEIHAQVLKGLSGTQAPASGTAAEWMRLLQETARPGAPRPAWLRAWEAMGKPGTSHSPEELGRLKEVLTIPGTPPWMRDEIQRLIREATPHPQAPAVMVEKPAQAPAHPREEPMLPADGTQSRHPRYIVIETALLPLEQAISLLPPLPLQPDMQVFIGGTAEPEPSLVRLSQLGATGVYRRDYTDPYTLEFHQRRLVKLPDSSAATRILARPARGAQALFEIIILPKGAPLKDAWAATAACVFRVEGKGTQALLDQAASDWLGSFFMPGSPPLRLQAVDDPSRRHRLRQEGRRFLAEPDLSLTADGGSKSRLAAIDQELESLRQGIRIDEERRGGLETTRLARAQKEEQARRLDESLAGRQQRLLQLEEDRRALLAGSPQSHSLAAGSYSLFAGARRLCEVRIENSQ